MLIPELGARYMGVFSEVHQALSSTCYSSITVVLWIETLQSQNQRCNWLGQGKPFSPSFSECFAELVSSPRNSLLIISHAFLTQQSCGRPALGNLGTVPCEEVEREPRDLRPAPQAQANSDVQQALVTNPTPLLSQLEASIPKYSFIRGRFIRHCGIPLGLNPGLTADCPRDLMSSSLSPSYTKGKIQSPALQGSQSQAQK